jgi:hypothetical protein
MSWVHAMPSQVQNSDSGQAQKKTFWARLVTGRSGAGADRITSLVSPTVSFPQFPSRTHTRFQGADPSELRTTRRAAAEASKRRGSRGGTLLPPLGSSSPCRNKHAWAATWPVAPTVLYYQTMRRRLAGTCRAGGCRVRGRWAARGPFGGGGLPPQSSMWRGDTHALPDSGGSDSEADKQARLSIFCSLPIIILFGRHLYKFPSANQWKASICWIFQKKTASAYKISRLNGDRK